VTNFEFRWRRLARVAGKVPEPPLPSLVPARLLWTSPEPQVLPGGGWALPASALILLNLVAMPFWGDAFEPWRAMSFREATRLPRLPTPPVSPPPALGLPSLAPFARSLAELKESLQ